MCENILTRAAATDALSKTLLSIGASWVGNYCGTLTTYGLRTLQDLLLIPGGVLGATAYVDSRLPSLYIYSVMGHILELSVSAVFEDLSTHVARTTTVYVPSVAVLQWMDAQVVLSKFFGFFEIVCYVLIPYIACFEVYSPCRLFNLCTCYFLIEYI